MSCEPCGATSVSQYWSVAAVSGGASQPGAAFAADAGTRKSARVLNSTRKPRRHIPNELRSGGAVDDNGAQPMSLLSIVVTALIGVGLLVMALRGGSFGTVERLQGSIAIWWVLGLGVAFGALPQRRLSRPFPAGLQDRGRSAP